MGYLEDTKVISARVPKGLAEDLDKYCKKHNITRQDVLVDGFTAKLGKQLELTDDGIPKVGSLGDPSNIDSETRKHLAQLAGGSAVGFLAYHGIHQMLKQGGHDLATCKKAAYAGAAAAAIATAFAIGSK